MITWLRHDLGTIGANLVNQSCRLVNERIVMVQFHIYKHSVSKAASVEKLGPHDRYILFQSSVETLGDCPR